MIACSYKSSQNQNQNIAREMWSCVAAPVHGAESRATARNPVGVSTCAKCHCDRCARRRCPTKSQYCCYGPPSEADPGLAIIFDSDPFAFEFVTFEKVPKSAIIDYRLPSSPRKVHTVLRLVDIIPRGCVRQEICTHSTRMGQVILKQRNAGFHYSSGEKY